MKSKARLTAIAVTSTLFLVTVAGGVQAKPNQNKRFSGHDRFQTSTSIAQQEYQGQQAQNVVIASAYNFPDALSASTLAAKLKASIILVGSDTSDSETSLDFIKNTIAAGGNVTIVGGVGAVNQNIEAWLHRNGYHVNRMGGKDRYSTNSLIVNNLAVTKGTPVIVVSGSNFSDALGAASLSASKGWPILLSESNHLPANVVNYVSSDQPTNIYIVGGKGVLNDSIQTALQNAAPSAQIQRFGGSDRYETLSQLLTQFYPNPSQIYLANGLDFADALSGSTLAAQNNAPILLINPKSSQLPPTIQDYLITIRNTGSTPQVNVLGGTASVPNKIVDLVNEILGSSGTSSGVTSLTVSNPTTTGFTVTLSSALNGLAAGNFTLTNSSGYSIPITGVTTSNGGLTYTLNAAMTAGQTYTLAAAYGGNALGTSQSFTVGYNNQTYSVSNPATTGFTVTLSSALNGLAAGNFTLTNSSGYSIPITGVTTSNGGLTYTLNAAMTAGQTYTLAANYGGYALGTSQSFTVGYNNQTYSVSNPTTTGLTVTLSSALNGLAAGNFTLTNSSGYSIPITGVTTSNGGLTYTLNAAMTAGQTYTLAANYGGYALGTSQSFTVGYNNQTFSISNPTTTGLTVTLSSALNGLAAGNFTLTNSSGYSIPITGVTTSNGGLTYTLNAAMTAGQTYTLAANYGGYTLGTSQSFTVGYNNMTFSVSNPVTTGFTVALNPALNGLTASSFTLKNSSGTIMNISSVTTSDSGTTYTVKAGLTLGQSYTLTANLDGYALGTAQSFTVPYSSETFSISNPSTSGLTVTLNPVLNGLSASNFTILNTSGNTIGVTGVTTSDGGTTYTLDAALTAGQTYTLSATLDNNAIGTAQSFTVPTE